MTQGNTSIRGNLREEFNDSSLQTWENYDFGKQYFNYLSLFVKHVAVPELFKKIIHSVIG